MKRELWSFGTFSESYRPMQYGPESPDWFYNFKDRPFLKYRGIFYIIVKSAFTTFS